MMMNRVWGRPKETVVVQESEETEADRMLAAMSVEELRRFIHGDKPQLCAVSDLPSED
jgi:hypothetical protein